MFTTLNLYYHITNIHIELERKNFGDMSEIMLNVKLIYADNSKHYSP